MPEKKSFDVEKARKFLRKREHAKKKHLEEDREKVLQIEKCNFQEYILKYGYKVK